MTSGSKRITSHSWMQISFRRTILFGLSIPCEFHMLVCEGKNIVFIYSGGFHLVELKSFLVKKAMTYIYLYLLTFDQRC
ncbi:hypothetical protein LOK49_LG11G01855 [Camellia lanceoleosa]|uniref:Uncharacterized protein n=1 Tax=Camellia lanceoleosa TaxID=1840588 RepID=A0ACC0FXR0_9ERIC|nr:hypothetical protein LOK49_LG11G01855 [Camellia lanceoleosa]